MQLSNNLTYKFLEVGNENTLVIIIDNFLASTESLISLASEKLYGAPPKDYTYPGIRTPIINKTYLHLLNNTITAIMKKHGLLQHDFKLNVDEATFSLLTKHEDELDPNHTIPHFDGPQGNRLAVLHYLNHGEFGGTAFYRHVPTQFENITADRVEQYVMSAENFAQNNPFTHKGFFTQSNNHYKVIDTIQYTPNRVVIYPVSILHSAFVKNIDSNIHLDPKKGRLTTNTFLTAYR